MTNVLAPGAFFSFEGLLTFFDEVLCLPDPLPGNPRVFRFVSVDDNNDMSSIESSKCECLGRFDGMFPIGMWNVRHCQR